MPSRRGIAAGGGSFMGRKASRKTAGRDSPVHKMTLIAGTLIRRSRDNNTQFPDR